MRKTRKLTIEEHRDLARRLRRLQDQARQIYGCISGCRLTSRIGDKVYSLERKLSLIRSELEEVMFRDHPFSSEATLEVYYGPREDEDGCAD